MDTVVDTAVEVFTAGPHVMTGVPDNCSPHAGTLYGEITDQSGVPFAEEGTEKLVETLQGRYADRHAATGRSATKRELGACIFLMGPGSIGFWLVTPLLAAPWQQLAGTALMLLALAGAAAFIWPKFSLKAIWRKPAH